jgi:hypothetical protein
MDFVQPPWWVMLLTPALILLQLAWYVGVTVLLIRIWRKVRHLPG